MLDIPQVISGDPAQGSGEETGSAANDRASIAERLIRRLRVSDSPELFQRQVVSAVADHLGVESVAWVPAAPREPVVISGQVDGLDDAGFRALVRHPDACTLWVVNRAGPPLPPGIRQLAVAVSAIDSPGSTAPATGWLAAINRRDGRPFAAEAETLRTVADLIATQRNNARLYGELKELLFGVIRALTAAIDAKDPYTSGHSERVARIAVRLGEQLGLSANARADLYLAGLLHDVGKIGIEDSVLKKAGQLSPDEFRLIENHVIIGVRILSDLKKLNHLLPGVKHHHERIDGRGYPTGLAGDAIPLSARILAVADAFDAMSSDRPYRDRLSLDQIDEKFRRGAGSQWDERVVEALFACRDDVYRIQQKGLGESLLRAVNDAIGRI